MKEIIKEMVSAVIVFAIVFLMFWLSAAEICRGEETETEVPPRPPEYEDGLRS